MKSLSRLNLLYVFCIQSFLHPKLTPPDRKSLIYWWTSTRAREIVFRVCWWGESEMWDVMVGRANKMWKLKILRWLKFLNKSLLLHILFSSILMREKSDLFINSKIWYKEGSVWITGLEVYHRCRCESSADNKNRTYFQWKIDQISCFVVSTIRHRRSFFIRQTRSQQQAAMSRVKLSCKSTRHENSRDVELFSFSSFAQFSQ